MYLVGMRKKEAGVKEKLVPGRGDFRDFGTETRGLGGKKRTETQRIEKYNDLIGSRAMPICKIFFMTLSPQYQKNHMPGRTSTESCISSSWVLGCLGNFLRLTIPYVTVINLLPQFNSLPVEAVTELNSSFLSHSGLDKIICNCS